MVAPFTTDIVVDSTPKRGGIVLKKCTVLYKCRDVLYRLLYEYPEASPSTKKVVVIESEVDLLTGVLWRQEGTVVPEYTASDVDKGLGGDQASGVFRRVSNGDSSRVASILSLGNVSQTAGEVGLADLY